jgi:hypothetical protein
MIPPSSLASLSRNGTRVGPTAAVERAHSDRARSGSKGAARVSFHPFHRARSASKKGTWPLPPLLADFFSILLEMGDERAEEWRCRYGNRRSFCATMGQFLQVAGLAGPGEGYTFRPSGIRRKGHNHAVDF